MGSSSFVIVHSEAKNLGRKIKPKFYLRRSWGHPDYFMICQASNNVLIAEIPERVHAEIILTYLNGLTWRELGGKVKDIGGPYTHIPSRRRNNR